MSFRYIYDAKTAIALQISELQSTAVIISVSTILSDRFLTKLTLRGEILHEDMSNHSMLVVNDTLKELQLYFKAVSGDALVALSQFRNLERLVLVIKPAVDFNDSIHSSFLVTLLKNLKHLKELSLNFRVQSPACARQILDVMASENHCLQNLNGIIWDFDYQYQVLAQGQLAYYLKLNRHGRRLWHLASVPIALWPKVLSKSNTKADDTDVLFATLRAVSWMMAR